MAEDAPSGSFDSLRIVQEMGFVATLVDFFDRKTEENRETGSSERHGPGPNRGIEEHKVPPAYERADDSARSFYGCRDDDPFG